MRESTVREFLSPVIVAARMSVGGFESQEMIDLYVLLPEDIRSIFGLATWPYQAYETEAEAEEHRPNLEQVFPVVMVTVDGKEIQLHPSYPWNYFMIDQAKWVEMAMKLAEEYGVTARKMWIIDHSAGYWQRQIRVHLLTAMERSCTTARI